jgi:hypothetical protein
MIFTKITYVHKIFFSTRIVQKFILMSYLENMDLFDLDKRYVVVVTTMATTMWVTKRWRPKVPTRRHFSGPFIINGESLP